MHEKLHCKTNTVQLIAVTHHNKVGGREVGGGGGGGGGEGGAYTRIVWARGTR